MNSKRYLLSRTGSPLLEIPGMQGSDVLEHTIAQRAPIQRTRLALLHQDVHDSFLGWPAVNICLCFVGPIRGRNPLTPYRPLGVGAYQIHKLYKNSGLKLCKLHQYQLRTFLLATLQCVFQCRSHSRVVIGLAVPPVWCRNQLRLLEDVLWLKPWGK